MATPVKRIEKEFLLKALFDEKLPVIYLKDRSKYILTLEKIVKGQLFLKSDQPVEGLKSRSRMDLMFDYRGQVITFTVEAVSAKDKNIIAEEPESFYKDLNRSYSRVSSPRDMEVNLGFAGDRYSLSYPRITTYTADEIEGFVRNLNPKNLQELVQQMALWIKNYADGYKVVIFKDTAPSSTEERIIAGTGKILFLPSTGGNFIEEDPYPLKRLITLEMFKRYLESAGVNAKYMIDAVNRFLKNKLADGVFSEAWIPLLFQEYVIGYIRIWIDKAEKPPFDYNIIDTVYQFATILTFSLKINGYFEKGKIKNEPFSGRIINISASGMLFALPRAGLSPALMPDMELSVQLIAPKRTVNCGARIVRRCGDASQGYYGCRFINMAPEDLRFLFEFIYGKSFNGDTEEMLFSAQA